MESYTTLAMRSGDPKRIEVCMFGLRAANHVIVAMIDDAENVDMHMSRWSHNERNFAEWQFANYHPELVP